MCLKLRIEKGFSSKQIAEVVGYSPTFINEIISRYNKHGVTGLQAKEQVENRRNLTLEQEKDILNSLLAKHILPNASIFHFQSNVLIRLSLLSYKLIDPLELSHMFSPSHFSCLRVSSASLP